VFQSGSLLVLPTNIRLGWKSMQVANTLAYYDAAIITTVKSFIVHAPGNLYKLKTQSPAVLAVQTCRKRQNKMRTRKFLDGCVVLIIG
jgi:hypothetical protein